MHARPSKKAVSVWPHMQACSCSGPDGHIVSWKRNEMMAPHMRCNCHLWQDPQLMPLFPAQPSAAAGALHWGPGQMDG